MQPVSRQRISKHVPVATNTHATLEFLLETAFSTRSVQMGYKEDNWGDHFARDGRVENPVWRWGRIPPP
jgi:hypothetical protein